MTNEPGQPEQSDPSLPEGQSQVGGESAEGYGSPTVGGAPVGGQAPAYGTPDVPQAPVKTNGLAIGSLVASLLGMLCGIGAIVGIVLGIVALNQINKRGEGGRNLAIAGIVVGVVAIGLGIVLAAARS